MPDPAAWLSQWQCRRRITCSAHRYGRSRKAECGACYGEDFLLADDQSFGQQTDQSFGHAYRNLFIVDITEKNDKFFAAEAHYDIVFAIIPPRRETRSVWCGEAVRRLTVAAAMIG